MSTGTAAVRSSGRPSWERDVIATLAVAAFSIAVAAGYARVFSGWDFMNDLVVVVVVGHGVGLVTRRLSVSAWLAVPAVAVALVWAIAALYYPDTMSFGLPTGSTWELFRFELTGVREQFQTAVAPVIYGAGWDVLAAIGLAIAVLLADVFAFRALARAEALVPGGVLFVFVGALGEDRLRVALTVVLIAVGVMTTAVLRSYYAPTTGRSSASARRLAPAVAAVAIAVAAVAGFVGPRLPGADAAPLYETRGRGGGVTEVVSPLVDIRSRLTNRSDSELFQVRASAESYWRVSALPEFDGTIWGLPERPLESTDDALAQPRSGTEELRQQITIVELGGSLVPAAPDPFQASGPTDLRWVAATSTLVTVDGALVVGDVIDVVSASPRFDPAVLAAATATDAGDPIYTDLPDDLPDVVAETAAEVTAGSTGAYESAILLQEWFRIQFDYSLDVQSGHGNNAIENFLRDRVGYCEQFAGTYAAMMRTLGVPTRVAVGFTPGTQTELGVYSVLGKNAHAWPEVWFDDIGWVAFEPTPGRGAPGAENYTGLVPATGHDRRRRGDRRGLAGRSSRPGGAACGIGSGVRAEHPGRVRGSDRCRSARRRGRLDQHRQRRSMDLDGRAGSGSARRGACGGSARPDARGRFDRASARADVGTILRSAGRRRSAGERSRRLRWRPPRSPGSTSRSSRDRWRCSPMPSPRRPTVRRARTVSTTWASTARARCASAATGRDRSTGR